MPPSNYYVIYQPEDDPGPRIDGPFDEAELLRRVTPGGFDPGTTYYGRRFRFLNALPKRSEDFPIDAFLILRAEIVVPREKRVAVELELPRS